MRANKKRSALHLGVTKSGVVRWVKVTAFRDESYSKAFQDCYRNLPNLDCMQSFECYLKDRQTKPFKKLVDSVYNKDLVLAVLREEQSK